MSVMMPIRITSPEIWAWAVPAAPQATRPARAMRLRAWVMESLLGALLWDGIGRSDAEQLVEHGLFLGQLAGGERLDDLAMLDHDEMVGQRRREAEVLLHHHDGEALRLQCHDHARERLHDHRRQAF